MIPKRSLYTSDREKTIARGAEKKKDRARRRKSREKS